MINIKLFKPTGNQRDYFWLALLAAVLLLGMLLLGGCQPRERVPEQVSRLLPAEREALAYRTLVLDNQLKVMLVSDPNADRSAAALAVGVGSLDDPTDRSGLVHFLEHMLFLGTEAYPEVGGYSKFMSAHAGSSNAYTADDHTNYFFSVSHDAFEEGLDRFAHFFIDPLFSQEYAEREANAVDSEHAKNIENDYWRVRQVQRLFYKPGHPIARFSTGTKETLRGVGRDELLAFHRAQYSANRMTLSVVGPGTLDELEALVRGRFDKIVNKNLPPNRRPREYLAPKAALRVVRVEPVADRRSLTLHFPLPPVEKDYRAAPLSMLGAVLGHEGEGSLLSLLKKDNLATSLSAGHGESTEDYASLDLSISLTPEGLKRYEDVIGQVFSAIAGLRAEGIPRYLFEEQRVMSALNHRFRSVGEAASQARQFSALMQRIPLDALPDDPFLLHEYAPELYRKLLAHLTPDNLLVTLSAKGVPTERTERYYGAKYGYRETSGEAYEGLASAQPDPRWHLPKPNAFIPERNGMLEPSGPLKVGLSTLYRLRKEGLPSSVEAKLAPLQGVAFTSVEALRGAVAQALDPAAHRRWFPVVLKHAVTLPVRLLDIPQAKVWYLPDWGLRQPKAQIVLKIYVEKDQASPRRAALGSLYAMAFEEGLNEAGYPIREAGLSYGVGKVKGGITLTLGGYSSRMLELLRFLTGRLNTVSIDEPTFAALKEEAIRSIENTRLQQPYQQSRYFSRLMLVEPSFSREAMLAAMRGVTLEDVRAYAGSFLGRIYVEGVVVGNLAPDAARLAVRDTLDTLAAGVLPKEERVEEVVRKLPPGADWVFSDRLEINNSLLSLMIQVGETNPTLRGALLIISRHLGQEFFFRMRTRQQLGYIVWAGMSQTKKTLQLNFLVQSGQYPADTLRKRIDAFLPEFLESFRNLPEERFEQYRQTVIQAKLDQDNTLGEIAGRLFWMAFRHDERFDHLSTDIAAVEALTREEVEAVMERVLTGPETKKLAIRLIGRDHPAGKPVGTPVRLPDSVRAKAG